MLGALAILIKVMLMVLLIAWAAHQPGHVTLETGPYTIDMAFGYFLAGLVLFMIVLAIVGRIFQALVSIPAWLARRRARKSLNKGHTALVRSLVALTSGDIRAADYQAIRAGRFLGGEERLAMIFQAHTAKLAGREYEAEKLFKKLRGDKETALLGMRGLMRAAIARGDMNAALDQAREALRLYPRQSVILRTVYDLEIGARAWDNALETLARLRKNKVLPREKCESDEVAIRVHLAQENLSAGYREQAVEQLRRAQKIQPGFTPMAATLARIYIEQNKRRRAIKVIEKAWKIQPHPDLVDLWDRLAPVNKPSAPMRRLRWFEKLLAQRPDSAEAQMAVAKAAIEDGLWGEARAYLAQAEKLRPSARLYRMWADLEDLSSHDDEAARAWMEKAAQARPDKVWICTRTGRIYDDWSAIATPHGAFNTIVWDDPDAWREYRAFAVDQATFSSMEDTPLLAGMTGAQDNVIEH